MLKNKRLYTKNKLKNDNIIVNDKIILLKSLSNKKSTLLTGKKPPDDIIDNDKLNASKVLKLIILKRINIIKVYEELIITIFNDCLKISL